MYATIELEEEEERCTLTSSEYSKKKQNKTKYETKIFLKRNSRFPSKMKIKKHKKINFFFLMLQQQESLIFTITTKKHIRQVKQPAYEPVTQKTSVCLPV